ncbi:MAG: response regulator [SAR324 cluster bacterium]|nr:response regulator [SAR324 cluster bacterium]
MAKILIVDDDFAIIEHVSNLLTLKGHTPLFTLYGKFLFDYLKTETPDLILLDVYMPEVNGVDLLKNLKNHLTFSQIPVIMLTGDVDEKLLEQCFSVGAVDFINKPVREVIFNARINAALMTQNNINTLHQLNLDLKTAQAELVQTAKLRGIAQMAEGIAHEINNPLCMISLIVEELKEAPKQRSMSEQLTQIEKLVDRCSKITHNLLLYSREDHFMQNQPFLINQCVEHMLDMITHHIQSNDIVLNLKIEPISDYIEGQNLLMEQALMNLTINAIEAMKPCEVKNLVIHVYEDHPWQVVDIQDTGIGISEEHLGLVMNPFFTTKDVGEGTGLGLTTSYGIIRNHGGTLELSSTLNEGTLIRVKLKKTGIKKKYFE